MIRSLVVTCSLFLSLFSFANNSKIVYGDDNRFDIDEVKSKKVKKLGSATAALVKNEKISFEGEKLRLKSGTLKEEMKVCEGERFEDQIVAAHCSGFLVGKDILVTAGHCVVSESDCKNNSWVFGYNQKNLMDDSITKGNVYSCKKILRSELNTTDMKDYAIVQLDRKVKGARPLKFRKRKEVKIGDPLVVLGHPSGLPLKAAAGATVKTTSHKEHFVADLDTFGGNSGSAVINTRTNRVEGILVRGAQDYKYDFSRSCFTVNRCDRMNEDSYSCMGESSTRIKNLNLKEFVGFGAFLRRVLGLESDVE